MEKKERKRILIILGIVLLFVVLFAVLSSAAEENAENEEEEEVVLEPPKAGITPDSPFYFIDEIVEEVTLKTKDGEEKAAYALEIAKEKAAEAQAMAAENKTEALAVALVNAKNASSIIEQEISPELEKQFAADQEQIKAILSDLQQQLPSTEEIQKIFDSLTDQVEKTKFALELAKKVSSLCEQLALVDYELMEQEEKCNPTTAPDWLKEHIETNIQQAQEHATNKFAEVLSACMLNPKECNCDDIPVQKMKSFCEKEKKLVILCDYENDEQACQQLDSEDKYVGQELLPEFMRDKYREIVDDAEEKMFDKFAPQECIDVGVKTREECEKIMVEKYGEPPEECVENGKFIGEKACTEKMIESGDMPEECVEDGKFVGEDACIEKMIDSGKIPEQCLENGKFIGREQCENLMMASGEIPEECIDNGRPVTEQQCLARMRDAGKIPDDCFDGDKFIGREACEEKLTEQHGPTPEECLQDNKFVGEEQCMINLRAAGKIPEDCFDGDKFIGREACEEKLRGKMQGRGGEGFAPQECMKDGEFIGQEECEAIIKEKYTQNGQGGPGEGFAGGAGEQGSAEECMKDGEFIGQEECETIMREKYQQGGYQQGSQGGYQGQGFPGNQPGEQGGAAQQVEPAPAEVLGGVTRQAQTQVAIPSFQQQQLPVGENYGDNRQFQFMGKLQKMQQEGRLGGRSLESLSKEEVQQLLHDAEQGSKEAADFTDVERLQREISQIEQQRENVGAEREENQNQSQEENHGEGKESEQQEEQLQQ